MRKLFASVVALLVCVLMTAASANAAVITYQTVVNGSYSDTTTNLNPDTFLSLPVSLTQFDPALGTLTGAQLTWDFGAQVTITPPDPVPNGDPNPWTGPGTVVFSFRSTTSSGPIPDNTRDPLLLLFGGPDGSAALSLALVTGGGTFDAGTYSGVLDLEQSLFPVSNTGDYGGLVKVTYTYTPNRVAPEPNSFLLLGTAFVGAGARRWRQRRW